MLYICAFLYIIPEQLYDCKYNIITKTKDNGKMQKYPL